MARALAFAFALLALALCGASAFNDRVRGAPRAR